MDEYTRQQSKQPLPVDVTMTDPSAPLGVRQYNDISLAGSSLGVFGDIIAQNVELRFNGEAKDVFKTMLGQLMADVATLKNRSKVVKKHKQSSKPRRKVLPTESSSQAISNYDVRRGDPISWSNTSRPHFTCRAERIFTRALLAHFNIYDSTSIHRIDELPYMKIAIRVTHAIDAYIANWVMINNGKDVFCPHRTLGAATVDYFHELGFHALYSPADRIATQLSFYSLGNLLCQKYENRPSTPDFLLSPCESPLGHIHPLSLICRLRLDVEYWGISYELVLLYFFESIMRTYHDRNLDIHDAYYMGGLIINFLKLSTQNSRVFSDYSNQKSCFEKAVIWAYAVFGEAAFVPVVLRMHQTNLQWLLTDYDGAIRIWTPLVLDERSDNDLLLRLSIAGAAYSAGRGLKIQGHFKKARHFLTRAVKLFLHMRAYANPYLCDTWSELVSISNSIEEKAEIKAIVHQFPKWFCVHMDDVVHVRYGSHGSLLCHLCCDID